MHVQPTVLEEKSTEKKVYADEKGNMIGSARNIEDKLIKCCCARYEGEEGEKPRHLMKVCGQVNALASLAP